MITLIISASIIGAFLTWRHGAKCYDKGITDAILMYRNGRLTYNSYLDDKGAEMLNIEIDTIDD
jgi:hypothetical protein